MVNHHPDTRLLNVFSSGTLPLAQSVCVSLHLKYCEQCQRNHRKLQQVGATLFEELAPQQVDDSLLQSVMSRLDEELPLSYGKCDDSGDYPALMHRLMSGKYEELEWKSVGPALRISHLQTGDRGHEFALYHIKAGDCICVGVLDAPIRFTKWNYRLLNPFLKLHAS